MEIYLKQKGLYYDVTKTCSYVCIKRINNDLTKLVEIHQSPATNGISILILEKHKNYLEVLKDHLNYEKASESEFNEAYKQAMNSLHDFKNLK